jgi:hypothetical protein
VNACVDMATDVVEVNLYVKLCKDGLTCGNLFPLLLSGSQSQFVSSGTPGYDVDGVNACSNIIVYSTSLEETITLGYSYNTATESSTGSEKLTWQDSIYYFPNSTVSLLDAYGTSTNYSAVLKYTGFCGESGC